MYQREREEEGGREEGVREEREREFGRFVSKCTGSASQLAPTPTLSNPGSVYYAPKRCW